METIVIIALIIACPFVVYLTAKLARYGWLKGEHSFKKDHKEESNGQSSGT